MLRKLGIYYILFGLKMILHPQIRKFAIIPLLINILFFAVATYFVWVLGQDFKDYLDFELPQWLNFLQYLVIPLFLLIFMVITYYLFASVAGIISAPFNGMLAAKAEEVIHGQKQIDEPISATIKDIPRILLHTLRVLLYTIPRMLLALILLFIPIIGQIAWILFSGWLTCIGYIDCCGDNHHKPLKSLLASMRNNRSACIGFGICVYFMMLIPVLNLFIIPSAVCGSTKLLSELDGGRIRGPKEILEDMQPEPLQETQTTDLPAETKDESVQN